MHYKDGTPATLGDIIQHDSGAVGIVIGGQIGNDFCSTQVVKFEPAAAGWGGIGAGFVGKLRDQTDANKVIARAAVAVTFDSAVQTRECLKIGHVDIGHG